MRSKASSFKCGNKNTKRLQSVSESSSRNIKINEYKKILVEEEYQRECENYITRSNNHEMYLRLVQKSTLSLFDDIRIYINNIQSKPWTYYH